MHNLVVSTSNQTFGRRTYDDEDQGETHRGGFEPTNHSTEGVAEFAVGEDEDEDDNNDNNERDEHRPSSSSAAYGDLDDRHVWNDGSGS